MDENKIKEIIFYIAGIVSENICEKVEKRLSKLESEIYLIKNDEDNKKDNDLYICRECGTQHDD